MHYFLKFIYRIELLHVSDRFSVRHRESSTVHTAIDSGILILLANSQHNLYDIYLLLCVQC